MSLQYTWLLAVAICIAIISGDISLDLETDDTSAWYPMTCSSSYCSNSTTFTLSSASQCYNPLLSVHFRLTDFFDSASQYLSLVVNQQKLGICTGPNNATFYAQYNASSIPLYQGCLNEFSIAELVGYDPADITLQLSLSPHVTDASRAFQGHLLYALVAISCSDQANNQIVSKDWDPSTSLPAFASLQCIHAGCEASALFNVIKPEHCRVPLLSLNFWLTDFDKDYEYLAVEVNGQYVGICQGGRQSALNEQALTTQQLDAYWSDLTFWCFQQLDVSRYTGLEPAEIEVRVRLQPTVDRNYLDASPTAYLLDAMVQVECGRQTQTEVLPSYMSYDRRGTQVAPPPQEATIECHEVECGAVWNWQILGECASPVLSVWYGVEHLDDVMFEVRVNERLLGSCGPVAASASATATASANDEPHKCFENVEFSELVSDYWQREPTAQQSSDDVMNEFIFGVDLTEIDVLDGIQNGSVARILVRLDCAQQSELKSEATVHITNDVTTENAHFPTGSAALSCAHAGCSVSATFILDVEFTQCEIPRLDVYFFLTDFASAAQYIAIEIDGHLYGWCDGGKSGDLALLYACLHRADIEEWVDWQQEHNTIQVVLNASSSVRALDHAKDGFLLSAVVGVTCESRATDTKNVWTAIATNVDGDSDSDAAAATSSTALAPVECQGVGCFAHVFFRVNGGTCYRPTLSVAFWLSDFESFDEYTLLFVNDNLVQKCYGGSDQDLAQIWSCFEDKDIRYLLHNYAYNHHSDTARYFVAQGSRLNVTLQMSTQSVWLDHSKNNSILQGNVRLTCHTTAMPRNDSVVADDDDVADADDAHFKYVALTLNLQNTDVEALRRYHAELATRFEYSLDATIHFEGDDDNAQDRIAFSVRCDVTTQSLAGVHMYVSTQSHADATQIQDLIAMDIFLFVFQETLRDSHFAESVLESISDVRLVSALPQTDDSTPSPTMTPTREAGDDDGDDLYASPHENGLKTLFSSASATDWLSFVAVLLLSVFVCLACLGGVAFACVRRQRQRLVAISNTKAYTKTKDSSDTDMDELQGMMDELSRSESISPHKSMASRRAGAASSPQAAHATKSSSLTAKVKRLASHGHARYAMVDQEDDRLDSLPSSSQRTSMHPALSSAIEAVDATQDWKHEVSKAHELVVSSAILAADDDEDEDHAESSPSGVDLSEEEFMVIDDDQHMDIQPQDIADLHEIQRQKSKERLKRADSAERESAESHDHDGVTYFINIRFTIYFYQIKALSWILIATKR